MADIKIKTHTTYTYETSDGREFDVVEEAEEWQEHLENIKSVVMLDNKFRRTDRTDEAYYVHIKTQAQLEAFEALQAYEGLASHVTSLGYWYYDEDMDEFIDVKEEMDRLQSIIESLDFLGK